MLLCTIMCEYVEITVDELLACLVSVTTGLPPATCSAPALNKIFIVQCTARTVPMPARVVAHVRIMQASETSGQTRVDES